MVVKMISVLLCFLVAAPNAYGIKSNERRSPMELTSSAFQHEGKIPDKYSCKGQDISPPLKWVNAPAGTKSFVLVCDDPDAPVGTWDHWLLFNIPASVSELPEGIPSQPELSNGARHGRNSWGRNDYGGPCPPGGTHRYFFKFYALDITLDLKPGAAKREIMKAMENHILAKTELMGRFSR
jgi:Raf kinase inhibitor-like YbhB/YbcL family protein